MIGAFAQLQLPLPLLSIFVPRDYARASCGNGRENTLADMDS
jgi:hypothetical protein